jgi:peptide/nickel transport system substrate-binding protein
VRTRWLLGLSLVALMAACTGERPEQLPAEKPVRGGVLVAAAKGDPGHLNPAVSSRGRVKRGSSLLYNSLLSFDEQLRPQPDLAERYEMEESGLVYRFTLRRGVRWHDGQPFTSADVKFTFEEILLKYHASTSAALADRLASIETPNDTTVVFRLKKPFAPFPLQVTSLGGPILPRHVFQGTDPLTNPANIKPVGTGPFKFISYVKDSEVRLARNPDYFKQGLPYFDEVVMRIIPDDGTRTLAFESGEVDYVFEVDPPIAPNLRANKEFVLVDTTVGADGVNCMTSVAFNLDRPALQDVRVRRAIFHAINREELFDRAFFRQGRVGTSPIVSGILWAHVDDLDLPDFDRAQAERLLEGAGWASQDAGVRVARGVPGVADGTSLSLDYVATVQPPVGELIREQLRAVGIEVALNQVSTELGTERVYKERDFDLTLFLACEGPDPEMGARPLFHSDSIQPIALTNASGYRNPSVDDLFDRAGVEQDRAERAELYKRIQLILVEDLPHVWLVERKNTDGFSTACAGFAIYSPLWAETAHCKR